MSQAQLESSELKTLIQEAVKEAVGEALSQQREMLQGIVSETLEEIAMARAIREGDQEDYVSRDEIFSILGEPA